MLGLDMGRSLTLWHNPDWDISRARKSILQMVPADPSAGLGLDPVVHRPRRHQRDSGCVRGGSAGSSGTGAGAGTKDSGTGFGARPGGLDPAETGTGLPADRLYRRDSEQLLVVAAAAGGFGGNGVRSGG